MQAQGRVRWGERVQGPVTLDKFCPSTWAWVSKSSLVKVCVLYERLTYALFHSKNGTSENTLATWGHASPVQEWEKAK